ncbi:MAG TPA: hypothetical protein VNT30_10370 [Stellaceae bacterium]|nr:hypothetical protein [Stellaceae bacterium]
MKQPKLKPITDMKTHPAVALPPAERASHDPVLLVDERDPDGWPVIHARALDNIARLLRDGVIDDAWADAGYHFRRDFARAQLDTLRAPDLARVPTTGGGQAPGDRIEDARERVASVMARLGGFGSPMGSVTWYVVGAEMPIADWARRQRWGGGTALNPHRATGLLIGALSTLSAVYRTRSRRSVPR